MIPLHLFNFQPANEVHIVGGGPSGYVHYTPFPVIAVNDAANRCGRPPTIHLSADYDYWKAKPVRRGSLGVWVQPADCTMPMFRSGGPQAYVNQWGDNWNTEFEPGGFGVPLAGGGGPCAIAIAVMYYFPTKIVLHGFEGGGKYDKINSKIGDIPKMGAVIEWAS